MTPAPITSSFSGTFSSSSAPVEVTTSFSSMSMPGSVAGTEPVAMTILRHSTVSVGPSALVTLTRPGALIAAVPRKAVILFFLNR